MKRKIKFISLSFIFLLLLALLAFTPYKASSDEQILSYIVDTKKQDLQLYWKNDKGEILKNFQHLKAYVESKNKTLIFAMNGGMFNKDFSPQGLYIQNRKTLAVIDTAGGSGNFYLKPNGVFYITTNNIPFVCSTAEYKDNGKIKFATQSGPMLIVDGKIHSVFKDGSTNLNIRNGVGILPNNKEYLLCRNQKSTFMTLLNIFKVWDAKTPYI